MGRTTFDWRWILVIVIVLMFFGQLRLYTGSGLDIFLFGLASYWTFRAGLGAWRDSGPVLGSSKVTYWRGQRIEMKQPRRARLRAPGTMQLAISVFYLALGVTFGIIALWAALRLLAP